MDLGDLRIVTTVAIVVWAFFLIGLERKFPYDPQRFFRTGFWTDFAWYTIIQSFGLGLLISWLIQVIDSGTGLSRLHLISDWPLWAQFLLFLVSHDIYIYWFHRWQHENKVLWRLHEAHHSVEDVDWVAGSRSHVLEIVINQTIEYAPIVLLGAAPEIALFKGLIDAVWGMWIHANVDVKTGWLQKIINGPEMHRWHHSIDAGIPGVNFSTKFAVWDWIFRTAFLPDYKPKAYGIVNHQAAYPARYGTRKDVLGWGWLMQNLYAFRPFPKESLAPASSPPLSAGESPSPR